MTRVKERFRKILVDLSAVSLAMKDRRTPILAKAIAFLAVAYALSPIDLIPDFIPVLGYLDDILILPALTALAVALIPRDVMDSCRERAAGLWEGGKPKKWYYALPIIAIYLLILFFVLRAIFR